MLKKPAVEVWPTSSETSYASISHRGTTIEFKVKVSACYRGVKSSPSGQFGCQMSSAYSASSVKVFSPIQITLSGADRIVIFFIASGAASSTMVEVVFVKVTPSSSQTKRK